MKSKITKNQKFEIRFYESILKRAPNFVQALMALGDLYTKAGLYEEGLKVDQRLSKLCPDEPVVLYNLACSYSLLNDIENAFKLIQRSVDYGFDNFELLERDIDLTNLRSDRRFKEYFQRIRHKNLAPKSKKHE